MKRATSGSNRPPNSAYRKKSRQRNRPLHNETHTGKSKVWYDQPKVSS